LILIALAPPNDDDFHQPHPMPKRGSHMGNSLGKKIIDLRKKLKLTQDQFGSKYEVSGPAIFKFEKGYVSPSLPLWLKFARDTGMSERESVLIWAKSKLPEKYEGCIDLTPPEEMEDGDSTVPAMLRILSRDALRKAITRDKKIPKGFRELIGDDEFWETFKPTGSEIYAATQKFGGYGKAKAEDFAEGLRLIRCFLNG
jgi:DNA-binding XRE family transcriptional regulator